MTCGLEPRNGRQHAQALPQSSSPRRRALFSIIFILFPTELRPAARDTSGRTPSEAPARTEAADSFRNERPHQLHPRSARGRAERSEQPHAPGPIGRGRPERSERHAYASSGPQAAAAPPGGRSSAPPPQQRHVPGPAPRPPAAPRGRRSPPRTAHAPVTRRVRAYARHAAGTTQPVGRARAAGPPRHPLTREPRPERGGRCNR